MSFSRQFLTEARQVIDGLDIDAIERVVAILAATRSFGRPAVHPRGGWECCECIARRQ